MLKVPYHAELSVIIVSYNTAQLIDEMMQALLASAQQRRLQVIAVDNASTDGSAKVFKTRYPWVELIESPHNIGFGRANNLALPRAHGRFVLLLNTDAFVAPDTLDKTLTYMESRPDCGVLGVRLVGRDGELQPSCRYFPTPWNTFLSRTGLQRWLPHDRLVDDMGWDHRSVRECDWVPGCYYLVRREVIDSAGLFDPRYFLYCEEVDHCRAVKAMGWKVLYFPYTEVVHIGGESAKTEGGLSAAGRQLSALQSESQMLYFRKHHGLPGLLLHAVLEFAAAALEIARDLLRGHPGERYAQTLTATALWWRVARRTGFGARPTR